MSIMRSIILLLFVIFINSVLCKNSELLSVTVLYRHGCRSPRILYKNDPYKNHASSIWPEGFGQLTNIGKTETYNLGQWYRKRYKYFLPKKYNQNFLRVLSSDKDRTLMSAACNLAGLYPPQEEQIWNKDIHWQPIPIHSIPRKYDGLILADERPCKRFDKLYQELLKSEEHVKFLESKKNIFEYVSKHSGDNINTTSDVIQLYDALFVEDYYNLSLPDWSKKVFPDKLYPLMTMTYALDTNTTELGRLKSGLLLDYITTFFENVLQDPINSQKFLMLSSHDSTIARLRNILGIYDYIWAEYASTLIFELRRDKEEVFIRIYFKDSKKIENLRIPDCTEDCNFDEFRNITKPFRINDEEWVKACSSV